MKLEIFKEIHFWSWEKMLADGQVAIRYKMGSGTAGTNSKVRKVHIFGVDFGERHRLVLHPYCYRKTKVLHLRQWYLARHWRRCYAYCSY